MITYLVYRTWFNPEFAPFEEADILGFCMMCILTLMLDFALFPLQIPFGILYFLLKGKFCG